MKLTKLIALTTLSLLVAASLVWSKDRVTTTTESYPGEEYVYFTVKLQNCHLLVFTSDAGKFLANPVAALRADGIAVPPAAEAHWRAVTVALRRLANPDLPPSSGSLSSRPGVGILKSQIARFELPGGWIPVAGDWNGDGTVTGRDFMSDPIRTLRAKGVAISTSDEPSWRQLAEALKSLRGIYARPNATLNRPGADLITTTPPTAAQRRRDIEVYSAQFYAGNRIESGTIVGTCNTAAGCNALKPACTTLKKHNFQTTNNSGMCVDQANSTSTGVFFLRNANTVAPPAAGEKKEANNQTSARRKNSAPQINEITVTKVTDSSTPQLNCEGAVLCGKVKKACLTLGGNYTQHNNIEGTCRY